MNCLKYDKMTWADKKEGLDENVEFLNFFFLAELYASPCTKGLF